MRNGIKAPGGTDPGNESRLASWQCLLFCFASATVTGETVTVYTDLHTLTHTRARGGRSEGRTVCRSEQPAAAQSCGTNHRQTVTASGVRRNSSGRRSCGRSWRTVSSCRQRRTASAPITGNGTGRGCGVSDQMRGAVPCVRSWSGSG